MVKRSSFLLYRWRPRTTIKLSKCSNCIYWATAILGSRYACCCRTVPSHSFKNPLEKVNCILNLALYGIGCMWKEIHEVPEFEKKLVNCSGDTDVVRTFTSKNSEKNRKLLHDSCQPCLDLGKSSFERLSLKGDQFVVWHYVSDDNVDAFFEEIGLDTELRPKDTVEMLPKCPKLSTLLKHSTKQRTQFFSIKKCGESNCS